MIAAFTLHDQNFIDSVYLVAAVLFILGLRFLSHPSTARRGNNIAAVGMGLALVVTLFNSQIEDYSLIVAGVVVGTIAGIWSARAVKMTAMPQMVALFNGVGGGAIALVAASEIHEAVRHGLDLEFQVALAIPLSAVIGSISFSGSMVAFAKLQELMTGRPVTYPLQKAINFLLILAAVVGIVYVAAGNIDENVVFALIAIALIVGVLFVLPIGGADMPVVISLLNSFTGLAAALAGFELGNTALLIGGTLVGASGTLLTIMMGKAMNRSLANVLFGAFGGGGSSGGAGVAEDLGDRSIKQIYAQDAAILLGYARSVIVVPGYGMAVAQAQHSVREMADILEKKGIDVKYAIHPVAGRMPGHMNVLLAEADVPYPQLFDMDDINSEFARTDVAMVIGANDVTNPAARSNPDSPIYGMPILNVDQAENVIVLKRSMNPGFAGIENELYYEEGTSMLFGDAKESVAAVCQELESL